MRKIPVLLFVVSLLCLVLLTGCGTNHQCGDTFQYTGDVDLAFTTVDQGKYIYPEWPYSNLLKDYSISTPDGVTVTNVKMETTQQSVQWQTSRVGEGLVDHTVIGVRIHITADVSIGVAEKCLGGVTKIGIHLPGTTQFAFSHGMVPLIVIGRGEVMYDKQVGYKILEFNTVTSPAELWWREFGKTVLTIIGVLLLLVVIVGYFFIR
jgi:hypothetical protein